MFRCFWFHSSRCLFLRMQYVLPPADIRISFPVSSPCSRPSWICSFSPSSWCNKLLVTVRMILLLAWECVSFRTPVGLNRCVREGFSHHFTCFEFWPHVAFIQHWHAERVNRYLPVPYRDREREREAFSYMLASLLQYPWIMPKLLWYMYIFYIHIYIYITLFLLEQGRVQIYIIINIHMIYCKCIYRYTHSIHRSNICFPGPLSPTPGSLHAMVSKLDHYKHHHHDWGREKPFTYHRIMCIISIHSKKGGDHGGAGTDMHGGHTHTHIQASLQVWFVGFNSFFTIWAFVLGFRICLCCPVRITISLAMILTEATGTGIFGLPIFMVVVIATWVGPASLNCQVSPCKFKAQIERPTSKIKKLFKNREHEGGRGPGLKRISWWGWEMMKTWCLSLSLPATVESGRRPGHELCKPC